MWGWAPGKHGLLMWLELGVLLHMCHHRGFPTSVFNLVSRDPLVVAAPQEHPSCLVLQVRKKAGGQVPLEEEEVLEGPGTEPGLAGHSS